MKELYTLLIIILVSIYKAENCTASEPTQANDCHKREQDTGDFRCCYAVEKYTFMGNYVDKKSCTSLSKDEFDNVKLLIKSLKQGIEKMGGKFEIYEIDCSSNYLYISLLSLMIILL